ncbi:MAG: hypothetical protein K1X66_03195 [Verrucomicrobiae bacterium]|nr:hypothetical protein [Verrucomicrobiae bacterium]
MAGKGKVKKGGRIDNGSVSRIDLRARLTAPGMSPSPRLDSAARDLTIQRFETGLRIAVDRAKEAAKALKESAVGTRSHHDSQFSNLPSAIENYHRIRSRVEQWRSENFAQLSPQQQSDIERVLRDADSTLRAQALVAGRSHTPISPPVPAETEVIKERKKEGEKEGRKGRKALEFSGESKDLASTALKEEGIDDIDLEEALARRRDTYLALQQAIESGDRASKRLARAKDNVARETLLDRAKSRGVSSSVVAAWETIKKDIKANKTKKETLQEKPLKEVKNYEETPGFEGAKTYLEQHDIQDPEVIAAFANVQTKYKAHLDSGNPSLGTAKTYQSYTNAQRRYRETCQKKGIDYETVGEPALAKWRDSSVNKHLELETRRDEFVVEISELEAVGIRDDLVLAKAFKDRKEAYLALKEAQREGQEDNITHAKENYERKQAAFEYRAKTHDKGVAEQAWESYKDSGAGRVVRYNIGEDALRRSGELLRQHGIDNDALRPHLARLMEAYQARQQAGGGVSRATIPADIDAEFNAARANFRKNCREAGIESETRSAILRDAKAEVNARPLNVGGVGRIFEVGAAVGAVLLLDEAESKAAESKPDFESQAMHAIATTVGLKAGDEDLVGALARLKKTSDKLGEARLAYKQVQGLWGKGVLEGENAKAYATEQSAVTEAQEQYREARNHFNEVCKSKGINGLQGEIIWDRMQGKYYTQEEMALAKMARDKAWTQWQEAAAAVPEAIKAAGKTKEDPNATGEQKAQAEQAVRAAVAEVAKKTKTYWVINSRYERMAGVMKVSLPSAKLAEETRAEQRSRVKGDQAEPSAQAVAQYAAAQAREAKEELAAAKVVASFMPDVAAQVAVVALAESRVKEAEALKQEARDAWVKEQVNKEFEKTLAQLPAEEAARIRESQEYLAGVEAAAEAAAEYRQEIWAGMIEDGGSTDVIGASLFTSLDASGMVDDFQDKLETPERVVAVVNHLKVAAHRYPAKSVEKRIEQAEADGQRAAESRFGIEGEVRDDIEIAEMATGRYPGREGVVIPYQTEASDLPADNRVAGGKKELGKSKNRETVWAAAAGENYTPDVSMSPNMDVCQEGGEYETAMSVEEQVSEPVFLAQAPTC